MNTKHISTSVVFPLLSVLVGACAQPTWTPTEPGAASVEVKPTEFKLANAAIEVRGQVGSGWALQVRDVWTGNRLASMAEPFVIVLRDGRSIPASSMKVLSPPAAEPIIALPGAARRADTFAGQAVCASMLDEPTGLRASWRIMLHDGANYLRQEVALAPNQRDVDVREIVLLDLPAAEARVAGTVPGSPVVCGQWFFGLEHPMSISKMETGRARCSIARALPLRANQTTAYSSVIGVSPQGQLRRGFLRYVELERAHPYRPFLHYNSWYDLAFGAKFNEVDCLERIKTYGTELVRKRGVKLDSYLFDDGWDDTNTTWAFHDGFPNGFAGLQKTAAEFGAAPGVWLSPWGGYGPSREQRLVAGKKGGYEVDSQGLALSGPKYYEQFRQVALDFVNKYGVNQFKFDGTGSPDKQYPGSAFGSDFEAAIQLIRDLRAAQPSLFINLTTGTWPSPFWTRYADSTWRGGHDHSFAGVGTDRQKWMTYRDGDTYQGVVRKGSLYPLNSLMVHGLIFAAHAEKLNADPNGDFRDEVRSYFGSGTQLQEMYITPALLSPKNWDDLAEAARWSRANADVLVDTHWVGGDPLKLEAYGWAAWRPGKGILTLRNPGDQPRTFDVDIAAQLELPPACKGTLTARSPWADERGRPEVVFPIGQIKTVELQPFQVLVWELSGA